MDSAQAASIIRAAHAKKPRVPVIAYDRLITGAYEDAYASFDGSVGVQQGKFMKATLPRAARLCRSPVRRPTTTLTCSTAAPCRFSNHCSIAASLQARLRQIHPELGRCHCAAGDGLGPQPAEQQGERRARRQRRHGRWCHHRAAGSEARRQDPSNRSGRHRRRHAADLPGQPEHDDLQARSVELGATGR